MHVTEQVRRDLPVGEPPGRFPPHEIPPVRWEVALDYRLYVVVVPGVDDGVTERDVRQQGRPGPGPCRGGEPPASDEGKGDQDNRI